MVVPRLPEAVRTVRQRLRDLLRQEEMTALELSHHLGIPEKEVYAHLEHVMRSTTGSGDNIRMRPSECLACGYVFSDRRRPSRPGRCPACRKSHLRPPAFRLG